MIPQELLSIVDCIAWKSLYGWRRGESIVTGYDIQASRLVHGTMLIDPHIGDEHRDCSKTTFITTSNNHTRPTDSFDL